MKFLFNARIGIEDWCFRTGPPHALAILRITLGLYLLIYWGLMFPNITELFSVDGLVLPFANSAVLTAPPVWLAYLLFSLFFLSLLLFTIGALFQIASATVFVFYSYYWMLSLHLLGGPLDLFVILILFILTFSGADRVYSFSIWKEYGSLNEWEAINVFPQRLIAIQIAVIYLGVGLQKLFLPARKSGEILYYSFIGNRGTPVAYLLTRIFPITFFKWILIFTKAFEILLPFGLWIKSIRKWFFIGGAILHLFFAITLGLWWLIAILPAYILFLTPEDAEEFCEAKLENLFSKLKKNS